MNRFEFFMGELRIMKRRDKINYYLDIAETVLKRGTCLRRNYGAIIVKNDEIISTGYSGAPRGRKNCIDLGYCMRDKLNIPRGQMYEKCRSVHAEMNACLSAARRDMIGATLYLVGRDAKTKELIRNANSCAMCKRIIINSGIERVIIRDAEDVYRMIDVEAWIDNDDSLTEKMGY
jgi:dCMP deaminase